MAVAVVMVGYLAGGGIPLAAALMTDSEADPSTFSTAACFSDASPPTIAGSVISKTVPYIPGFVRQGGTYYVYANASDVGCGLAGVIADVSVLTTGQTAVPLVTGAYSVGGVSYGYRSTSLTADATLAAGSKAYTVTATDAGSNATFAGFGVTVDNTRPAGADVQTANNGTWSGGPEPGDTVTFTYSELIDPQSVLAGWTGGSTNVVVRIVDNAGGDVLTVRNAANSAQLPLGNVNLAGTSYVSATRTFGATGTPSTMTASGNAFIITLGTASGSTGLELVGGSMSWTPSSTATDRAGNLCRTLVITESGISDVEF